jgi:FkbM family methyltransferase
MWHPFSSKNFFVLLYKRFFGSTLQIQHKFFNNANVGFNLSDSFEMVIAKEFFKDNIYNLNKLSFKPSIIFDFGAHVGFFSLLIARKFPGTTVHSFEPMDNNFNKLKLMVEQNNLPNFHLHKSAIGVKNTETFFYTNGLSSSIDNTTVESVDKVIVKVENIYDLPISKNSLLMKMDIEGSEVEIFPEIISKLPPTCAIFLEVHDGWPVLQGIKDEFLRHGFSFEVTTERGRYIDIFSQRLN